MALLRISGPDADQALAAFGVAAVAPRRASLRRLRDADGAIIDDALVLRFKAPASYTGEDVVELHHHGSLAVTAALAGRLGQLPGFRLAEPGEFTRRALANGRLDLVEVEALADLIAAETEAQRRQAVALMTGRLSRLVASWGEDLTRALSLVEAGIDFADEDLPDLLPLVAPLLARVASSLARELEGSAVAERIRDGFEVALVGAPNVGKSTLLNALAGRPAAITSEIAGTTRDVIEVRMDLGGLAVTLLDMAGLRESRDPVEALGIGRARERAMAADLRVFLVEAGVPHELEGLLREGDLVVQAKADLGVDGAMVISGLTGLGVPELLAQIEAGLSGRAAGASSVVRARQRAAVRDGLAAVQRAEAALRVEQPAVEIVALEIGSALRALDFLVGRVDVEAVLDTIFTSFCLGK